MKYTKSTQLGPGNQSKCPSCGNSSQNGIPEGKTDNSFFPLSYLRRCADCKTVFEVCDMELHDEYYVGKYRFDLLDKRVRFAGSSIRGSFKRPSYYCKVFCGTSTWITTVIAEVKQKNDGRWWWGQKKNTWEKWTVDKQGIAATMKEAMELAVKNYTNAE